MSARSGKNETIKTPKLNSDERVKLIDRPDLLVVVPKTHAAAVRYGAGSKWCTSVVSDSSYFRQYTSKGFLVYMILYKTLKGERSEEMTKVAMDCVPDINKPRTLKITVWSKDNTAVENTIAEVFILNDELMKVIWQYYDRYIIEKYGYAIGSTIKCTNHCGKFDTIEIIIKGDNWSSTLWLNPRDIGECVVTKINEKSVRADVKELRLKTTLPKDIKKRLIEMVKANKLNINIRNEYIDGNNKAQAKTKNIKVNGVDLVIGDNPMNPETYTGWFVELNEDSIAEDYYHQDAGDNMEGFDLSQCFPVLSGLDER